VTKFATKEDDISELVNSLRQESSTYFSRATKKVKVLTKLELSHLEEILSIRKSEEQYENKKLGMPTFSRLSQFLNRDNRFKQLCLAYCVLLLLWESLGIFPGFEY
jgi:hypothetical protein